jgi:hypothetical protein
MLRERHSQSSIFTRPSKRKELISKQPSEKRAWEITQEWAETIVNMNQAERFGVLMEPMGRGFWGVFLIDRSLSED